MYFGLTRAPTYYMDLMNTDFIEYLGKFIVESTDDILIYTTDEEEHEENTPS
jgi:hypothetical protein